jgi:hypothetical protein
MKRFACIFLIFLATACSPTKIPFVQQTFDSKTDLSQLHTFSFKDDNAVKGTNPRYQNALRAALQTNLEHKGFQLVSNRADFWVDARLNLETKTTVIEDASYLKSNLRSSDGKPVILKVQQGAVLVNFINQTSEELFFQGLAKSEINHANSPEKREQRIALAVEQILENFPPK